MEELDLEEICSGRSWNLHLCSYKDIDVVRDGFTKLSLHLLPAPTEVNEEQVNTEKAVEQNKI